MLPFLWMRSAKFGCQSLFLLRSAELDASRLHCERSKTVAAAVDNGQVESCDGNPQAQAAAEPADNQEPDRSCPPRDWVRRLP
jgi:hypothetical protein